MTPTPTNTPTPSITPTSPVTPTPTPTPSSTSILYYTLNSCNVGDPLYDTTIQPILENQRYVDPGTGRYWIWDNAAGTSTPQQTVNPSLQIASGFSGCTDPPPTPSPTETPSETPTSTPTQTSTATVTATPTVTTTPTTTNTPTTTTTITATQTQTPTSTQTPIAYGYWSSENYSNATDACRLSSLPNATLYAAPGNTTPFVGMVLYTTPSPLSNPFDGSNRYWRLQIGITVWGIEIGSLGTVLTVTDCSTIPSNTPTPTNTQTPTQTPTQTASQTPTQTATQTPTQTATQTRTPTQTPTTTTTITATQTQTPTPSQQPVAYGYWSSANYSNATDACRLSSLPNATLYAAPGNTTPFVGMVLYTTQTPLSNPFDGSNRYWRLQRGATVWGIEIGSLGTVLTVTDCSTIPSNTPTPSNTQTPTPSNTQTPTPSNTQTPTPSNTQTPTPSNTQTPTPSNTQTPTPTNTQTPTPSQVPIAYGYWSSANYSNATDACRLSSLPNASLYAAPGNTSPFVGMILYTTQTPLSNPFDGSNRYWRIQRGATVWGIDPNINSNTNSNTNPNTNPNINSNTNSNTN